MLVQQGHTPLRESRTNLAQWRVQLGRVLFNIRWKLFGSGESGYYCLTVRMPVAGDIPSDGQHLTLRQVLRARSGR